MSCTCGLIISHILLVAFLSHSFHSQFNYDISDYCLIRLVICFPCCTRLILSTTVMNFTEEIWGLYGSGSHQEKHCLCHILHPGFYHCGALEHFGALDLLSPGTHISIRGHPEAPVSCRHLLHPYFIHVYSLPPV